MVCVITAGYHSIPLFLHVRVPDRVPAVSTVCTPVSSGNSQICYDLAGLPRADGDLICLASSGETRCLSVKQLWLGLKLRKKQNETKHNTTFSLLSELRA